MFLHQKTIHTGEGMPSFVSIAPAVSAPSRWQNHIPGTKFPSIGRVLKVSREILDKTLVQRVLLFCYYNVSVCHGLALQWRSTVPIRWRRRPSRSDTGGVVGRRAPVPAHTDSYISRHGPQVSISSTPIPLQTTWSWWVTHTVVDHRVTAKHFDLYWWEVRWTGSKVKILVIIRNRGKQPCPERVLQCCFKDSKDRCDHLNNLWLSCNKPQLYR